MAPRAEKIDDNRKVFYWPDTGAVEATLEEGKIVQAVTVETTTVKFKDGVEVTLPMLWSAGQ